MRKFIIEGQDIIGMFYNREDVERILVCTEEPYETDIEPNVDWYQIVEFGYRGIAVDCLLYTSPSPRDRTRSRMPSSA